MGKTPKQVAETTSQTFEVTICDLKDHVAVSYRFAYSIRRSRSSAEI